MRSRLRPVIAVVSDQDDTSASMIPCANSGSRTDPRRTLQPLRPADPGPV